MRRKVLRFIIPWSVAPPAHLMTPYPNLKGKYLGFCNREFQLGFVLLLEIGKKGLGKMGFRTDF